MTSAKKKILVAGAACILAVASLCLVAVGAAKPPAKPPAKGRPAAARQKRPKRVEVALKIGQMAPDFELYTLGNAITMLRRTAAKPSAKATSQPAAQPAEGKVRLSSFRGKRPVYLIFASYR